LDVRLELIYYPDNPSVLELSFGHNSRNLNPTNERPEFYAGVFFKGEIKEAKMGNNHSGVVLRSESTTDLSRQLGDGYVLNPRYAVQLIQNGQELKLYGFNTNIVALEWPRWSCTI
jgi:hypothetical protein